MSTQLDPVPASLLALLRCPITRQPLRRATAAEVAALNAGRAEPLAGALVRADGTAFYPIRDSFPVLLPEAAEAWPAGLPSEPVG